MEYFLLSSKEAAVAVSPGTVSFAFVKSTKAYVYLRVVITVNRLTNSNATSLFLSTFCLFWNAKMPSPGVSI